MSRVAEMIADMIGRVEVVRDSLAGGEIVTQRLSAEWREVGLVIARSKKSSMRARQLSVHAAIEGVSTTTNAAASFGIVADRMRELSETMAATTGKIAGIVRYTIGTAETADGIVHTARDAMDQILGRLALPQASLSAAVEASDTGDILASEALQERALAHFRGCLESFQFGHELGQQADDAVAAISAAANDAERLLAQVSSFAADTKVLAINAAIQAIRAGGRGLSFNVVAGEMGRLAQRTHDDVALVVGAITKLRARTERFRSDSTTTMANLSAVHEMAREAQTLLQRAKPILA